MVDCISTKEDQTDPAVLRQIATKLARNTTTLADENAYLRRRVAELEQAVQHAGAAPAYAGEARMPAQSDATPLELIADVQLDGQHQAGELRIFYALAENAPDAIAVARLDTGCITYANPAFQQLFGYNEKDIVQLHFLAAYAEPSEKMQVIVHKAIDRGFWQGMLTCKRRDDSRFLGQLSGMVLRDSQGQLWAVAGIIRDITQQQEYERQLRLLEAVIEHTSETVMLTDLAGIITYINPAGARMNGSTTAEMTGQHYHHFIAPEEITRQEEEIIPHLLQAGHWEGRIWAVRPNGAPWLMQTSIVVLRDADDAPFAYAAIERDATAEEIAAQELRQLNRELAQAARLKDEFLASMSHELRTPLNAVLGLAEALQEGVYGGLTPKQVDTLRIIAESGNHLLMLINDVLDLAKIEAGKTELQISTIAVEQVCHNSLQFIQTEAARKHLIISFSLDTAVRFVQADERRLKQILVNLLNNAVKFTPAGGQIGLDITGDTDAGRVAFTVWDTGIGIAPEDMGRLFKPFMQLDSRLAREYEGTGLGLSLVARLVELHGGGVDLTSTPGAGSRFTVSLPWGAAERQGLPTPPAKPRPSLPVPLQSGDQATAPLILLAEDNESNIIVTADYLAKTGYRVAVARDGAAAVQQVQQERPALILMDLQMPVMDGVEAIRRIRADAAFADIPIIALTALVMPGDREGCLRAGANDYLCKPVSLRTLLEVIGQYVE
jgi:PAS domain S-box-containing protein